ncbi:MAG TPA: hypothetical protein VLG50_03420 [Candidatus Saccharimonadales bacterium]|nr:hypothetical protein [Candidatus Saccharimonadales bacterium]
MKQKFSILLLSFSFFIQQTAFAAHNNEYNRGVIPSTLRNSNTLVRDAEIRRLDRMLKRQLHLNDQQVSSFTNQILSFASREPLVVDATLPIHISLKDDEKIVLPTKVLILTASVINMQRRVNGTCNYRLQQEEERIIERHLEQNQDYFGIRKITHDWGFYYTFDGRQSIY